MKQVKVTVTEKHCFDFQTHCYLWKTLEALLTPLIKTSLNCHSDARDQTCYFVWFYRAGRDSSAWLEAQTVFATGIDQ